MDNGLSNDGGYFRPESPYLPGSAMRRADQPVDLDQLKTSQRRLHQVKMTSVSASWAGDEKMVVKDISFEVNKVRELHVASRPLLAAIVSLHVAVHCIIYYWATIGVNKGNSQWTVYSCILSLL